MNKIFFYSLYAFSAILFIVGLFLPPTPSFCFVLPAIGLVSVLTSFLLLEKVVPRLKYFKWTLYLFVLVTIYHLAWLLVSFLEIPLHWSNGTESLLFFYYMTMVPLRILPQIFSHEGVNMIFYSIVIPVLVGLCCDGYFLGRSNKQT